MDLKIDSIVYIILFLIPGFIFYKVAARYIVHEKYDGSEKLISILAASSFIHALGAPVFLSSVNRSVPWQLGIGLVLLLLIWPTLAGFAFGRFSGGTWGEWMRRFLGANPREPTAWGYFWGQRRPMIVRAVLDDGSVMVGRFSANSSASIPGTDDLYLEEQYLLDDERKPCGIDANTKGCWIPAARLRLVEFYEPPKDQPKEEDANDKSKTGDGNSSSQQANSSGQVDSQ
jgi:Family of unknown function (DUF6338)